ncbi:flagellar biosynthesis anti-sigma factor FlgM [Ureibacillus chungkukjangi]|uniref:flagellar biosynthesis anti-sigma factor FlgM n=1 Tax=Ureibacillus chungkukjangi TaxID=1202712 RepID=UPI00203F340A|nr:flagellar biosynthesis anti-sigma factor FlgM [Ureibacillus chungkukjangi]MCM3389101.1 flagellar biosynthesis anti-sigma factor FlgM [Ureibacillus chungkukjangi]
MKITSFGVNSVNPYNKQQRSLKAAESKSVAATDKIEISSAAKEMSASSTSTYSTERAQKIQQLKEEIHSGNYQVDSRKVAEDMLNYYRK